MLKEERQHYILNKLREDERVNSLELSKELDVSDDTIRRDLTELAREGLIQKVHGGAIPKPPAPIGYLERLHYGEKTKQQLAEKLPDFLFPGMVLIVDGGTTNLIAIKQLPPTIKMTVVTNSLPVAAELSRHEYVDIIFLGGNILKSSQASIGSEAMDTLDNIYADLCLMGTCSFHPEVGLTSTDKDESALKRKMVSSSKKVLLLATEDKLNTASNFKVCPPGDIDFLVTEKSVEKEVLNAFEKQEIEIYTI